MKVNERIRAYLLEHGIKQNFLVENTGMPQYVVSNLLNGKRKITADELSKISRALGVNPNIFLE